MDFQEREAIVRASVDGWNSADWEEGLRRIWDPEGAVVAPEGWPESGTFRGWDEMIGQWRRIKDSWGEENVELRSVEPAGEGALADVRWVLRGEASGAPLEVEAWILAEFKGRRLSKMTYFLDGDAARSAAASLES